MKQIILLLATLCIASVLIAQKKAYVVDFLPADKGPVEQLGHGKQVEREWTFKNGDTILARTGTLVVTDAAKLNRKLSYYSQGFRNPSMHQLKRVIYRFTKPANTIKS